jgi:hypothetical protein
MEPPFSFACYRVRACILNCYYLHILISWSVILMFCYRWSDVLQRSHR